MLKGIFRIFLITILLVIFTSESCCSQDLPPKSVKVMFYNVENLFDVFDDPLTEDNDFLPNGLMRWNLTRYNKKISNLYKVIVAVGEWDPPAIIGFCEIENRKVLEDLIYSTYLSKFNYSIVHEDSPDRRGIDVCLIYRKKIASIISYKYWIPSENKLVDISSRSILYAKIKINSDTIHVIVNHWPSRRGGVLTGEDYRFRIASMVREKVDSIVEINGSKSKIIILGDFNCNPEDMVIKSLVYSADSTKTVTNLSESLNSHGYGTYRYMGSWEMIDQVMVSKGLISALEGFYTEPDMVRIFRPDFLLKKDPKYPGFMPFSTYRGYKYQGGFSDHLPLLVDLKTR